MTDMDHPIIIERHSNPNKPDQEVEKRQNVCSMERLSIYDHFNDDDEQYLSPNPSTASSSSNSHFTASIASIPNTIQSNDNDAASSSTSASSSQYHRYKNSSHANSYKSNNSTTAAHITPQHLSLDHSHLKPGQNASLLSYVQTINMYRENAKKTHNPDIQCELAKFIIEAAMASSESPSAKEEYIQDAEKLLKQLSLKGHANAQYELAKLLAAGLLHNKPELEKAFSLFVHASKHSHADASYRAAECYEKGLGCHVNGSKAVQYYKLAASFGHHPGAMYKLGTANLNGDMGLHKNPKDAVKWLNRSVEAATSKYPEALYELANLHTQGIPNVIFVDLNYAVSLYIQAADIFSHAPSAFKMGESYEYGRLGCKPDPALSIHYYTIAAEKAHREACFALTAWYLVGFPNVLPQSDHQAYLWAKRAADLQLPKAEYAVGYFTESGIGCVKNQAEAIQWYTKAAKHGYKHAAQRLQQGKMPIIVKQDLQKEQHQHDSDQSGKKKKSVSDDCRIM